MIFKAKIESINLEKDADFTRITLNHIKFNNPILDEMFILLSQGEIVEIELKR
jgi:hypothetical protein